MNQPSDQKPAPVTMAMKKLTTPLAHEVAELLLLKADMESIIEGFKLYGMVAENPDDPKQNRAALSLFRDSIVQLVACFDDANAYNLKAEDVFGKVENGLGYFRWAKDLRDTWIAHRIGPARLAAYGFVIHPDTGDIIGEGPFIMTPAAPDKKEAPQLIRFTRIALDHVDSLIKEKSALLRKEADRLYPSQRKRLPDARLVVAEAKQARMGRRKFQNVVDQRARNSKKLRDDH